MHFLLSNGDDFLIDRVFGNESVDGDRFLLAQSMTSVFSLSINLWVEIDVVKNYGVSAVKFSP